MVIITPSISAPKENKAGYYCNASKVHNSKNLFSDHRSNPIFRMKPFVEEDSGKWMFMLTADVDNLCFEPHEIPTDVGQRIEGNLTCSDLSSGKEEQYSYVCVLESIVEKCKENGSSMPIGISSKELSSAELETLLKDMQSLQK